MNSAGKRRRACRLVVMMPAAASLGASIAAAAGPRLTPPDPVMTTPRFGVAAAWPHWTLAADSADRGPKPRNGQSLAVDVPHPPPPVISGGSTPVIPPSTRALTSFPTDAAALL